MQFFTSFYLKRPELIAKKKLKMTRFLSMASDTYKPLSGMIRTTATLSHLSKTSCILSVAITYINELIQHLSFYVRSLFSLVN